jgi:hypothetical protein
MRNSNQDSSFLDILLSYLQMSAAVPLTARTLANSHQTDLQRIANPRLEVNERRLRPIYDYMEIHKYEIDPVLNRIFHRIEEGMVKVKHTG